MGAENNLPHYHSGKVRETKMIPGFQERLLPIATDRFSTHNVVHATEIPGKGELLTAQTVFWVEKLLDHIGIEHHIVASGRDIYTYLPKDDYDPRLHYRALVVKRLKMIPREFVFRNYITGSLDVAYNKGKDPYGLRLPAGLKKMHQFDVPLFTPTDKSETDDPCLSSDVVHAFPLAYQNGAQVFAEMTKYLDQLDIALIDGKMEFSVSGILADEFGTGDCCRLTWKERIQEGADPPWLDKENGRQIALRKWNGGPKVPLTFSDAEVKQILDGYHQAFEAITGQTLSEFQKQYFD